MRHPESHGEDLEDIKGVEDFSDQNLAAALPRHGDFAVAKFHSLKVSHVIVSDATRVRKNGAKLVVRKLTIESNGNEFISLRPPIEVNEAIGEEDRQTFDIRVCFSCMINELV